MLRPLRVWLAAAAVCCLIVVPGQGARIQQGENLICPTCEGCTSILVGKGASADGSTMTSHSCDSTTDRTWMNMVPHRKHAPGEMAKVYYEPKRTKGPDDPDRIETGEIPQVPETYAYLNAAYPIMNEHQLAIGETTFGGKREMVSDKGIIDCPELYRLVLERAKTAREAIRIADELTKKYGYNDAGEAFTFADPNEVWIFEILGPGKGNTGAVWAAVRIPDDNVFVSANAPRIRTLDSADTDHYLASANVFSLAEQLGYWSAKSGERFEFCATYGSRNAMGSRRREWRALSRIAPSLKLDPNSENYPLSVKAEKKLSVKDILDIFRDTYQDTPFDMTRSLNTIGKDGRATKNPIANPFMSQDYLDAFNISSERTIACKRATYLQVTQSRRGLPDPIGGVVWLGTTTRRRRPTCRSISASRTCPRPTRWMAARSSGATRPGGPSARSASSRHSAGRTCRRTCRRCGNRSRPRRSPIKRRSKRKPCASRRRTPRRPGSS